MVDEIYWKFVDRKFFGALTSSEDRVGLLSTEERETMGAFTEKKMREANEGGLVSHYSIDELVDM